jgi:hypothetical protein
MLEVRDAVVGVCGRFARGVFVSLLSERSRRRTREDCPSLAALCRSSSSTLHFWIYGQLLDHTIHDLLHVAPDASMAGINLMWEYLPCHSRSHLAAPQRDAIQRGHISLWYVVLWGHT